MELQDTLRVKKSNSVALGWLNMQHHSLRGKSLGLGAPGDGSDPPPRATGKTCAEVAASGGTFKRKEMKHMAV